jgi:hypothetical protein
VTTERQAILLNAVPLLVLGGLYLLAAAAIAPSVWRERHALRELDLTQAVMFPSSGVAALVVGLVVLDAREPIGGEPWLALVGIAAAAVPPLVFFARWRDRGVVLTAVRRAREAEELTTARERERESVSAFSNALARSLGAEDAGRVLVDWVTELVGSRFRRPGLDRGA